MLTAQCNKLQPKEPHIHHVDSEGVRGFHPWKKPDTSPKNHSPRSDHEQSSLASPNHVTVTSSSPGDYPHSSASSFFGGYPGNVYSSSSGLMEGRAASEGHTFTGSFYSRIPSYPYDSWPFAVASPASQPSHKQDGDGHVAPASAWWEMHSGAPTWPTAGTYNTQLSSYKDKDYTLTPLTASGTPLLPSSGHQLLHDSYRSMLPSGHESYKSLLPGPHHPYQSSLPTSQPDYPVSISSTSSANGGSSMAPSRAKRRATARTTCDCPNCQEADLYGPERPYLRDRNVHSCHIPGCGKVYTKTSHLKAHLHWHTKERLFVCNWLFCGKRFQQSAELQAHLQTHSGEKRFACPVCNKRFMKTADLGQHVKLHSQDASEKTDTKISDHSRTVDGDAQRNSHKKMGNSIN